MKDIYITRDLKRFQSISERLAELGYTSEYRVLDLEVVEANRYISRMLKVPLASRVLHFRKMRLVEGLPKCIERTYILYDKVAGVEKEDLAHRSFYAVIREKFGYATRRDEEEILLVTPGEEERRLLQCPDDELLMIRGVTYKEDPEPFEYYEIVSVTDFYRFKSEDIG